MRDEQFKKELFDYSVARLRVSFFSGAMLKASRIKDTYERQIKMDQLLERLAYETYAFGYDQSTQDMVDKLFNINLEAERLYQNGLLVDGSEFVRKLEC